MPDNDCPYVSRGGVKLAAALDHFGLDVASMICCDLGCHAGGFVDCLLQNGAQRVYAVDPGYGVLDYRIRQDARVVVFERTNALEFACPEPCGLVTVDVGWTPQRVILPAVRRCLGDGPGRVVTLVKPHYEAAKERLRKGVLLAEWLGETLTQCREDVRQLGWVIAGEMESPIQGHGGNTEFLWLLEQAAE